MNAGFGIWMSTANVALAEVARDAGFEYCLLDLEHGVFDNAALDTLTGFLRRDGLSMLLKCSAPEGWAVMQALDRGASGIVVPQIRDLDHAREVSSFSKYPPMGRRGASGGRVFNYGAVDAVFYKRQNAERPCYIMIETAGALCDAEAIADLPTVDGLFVGPTDLALSRGRDAYERSVLDRADIAAVASAARKAGKPWIFPAWTAQEQEWAAELGASVVFVSNEFSVLTSGVAVDLAAARSMFGSQ